MKKRNLLSIMLCLVFSSGFVFSVQAQTDPGTENLTHQWSFVDGLREDVVGGVFGELVGDASIDEDLDALHLADEGEYFSIPGEELALNEYDAITFELWAEVDTGEWNMMIYFFGDTAGGIGTYGTFMTGERAAISTVGESPWDNEDEVRPGGILGVDTVFHLVATLSSDSIGYYIDGVSQGSTALQEHNRLDSISTATAFLGKSGYAADPTWKGLIYKFSIYDKALTTDEVAFRYDLGQDHVDIEEEEEETSVPLSSISDQHRVYFNNAGLLAINMELMTPSDVQITVYDLLGRVVTTQQDSYNPGTQHTVLDVHIPSGIYIVNINQNGKSASYKVLKSQ